MITEALKSFVYTARPGRVVFGSGTLARLHDEVEAAGLKRVLVLSTAAQAGEAEDVAARLGTLTAGTFARAEMHTPVAVTEAAIQVVDNLRVDGVVSIGGGSTIGLGKAIAWRTDLPQVVVPTSYAGSEMTSILGETDETGKTTRSDARILPEVVIYDVDLSMSLTVAMSGASGLNAVAHAIEALYARDRNPIVSLMAIEGIAALVRALPLIASNPLDVHARTDALYGAWLCGTCLGSVGMALHHKLCHALGGSLGLPHAETHAALLPHALAYNAPAVPEIIELLRPVLGDDPADGLYQLAGRIGLERSLGALGMNEADVEPMTAKALANPYWNPRPLEPVFIRQLLENAWRGAAPTVAAPYR